MSENEVKDMWKNQAAPAGAFSIEQLRKAASKLQRRVKVRNAIEYVAMVFVTLSFVNYIFVFPHTLMRIGSVLMILGTGIVGYQLHRRASGKPLPDDFALRSGLEFYRAQLLRQREALRSAWLWYIAPIVPGVIVFRWGVETELGAGAPFARGPVANLVIAIVLLVIVVHNQMGAWRIQRKIEKLDAEAGD